MISPQKLPDWPQIEYFTPFGALLPGISHISAMPSGIMNGLYDRSFMNSSASLSVSILLQSFGVPILCWILDVIIPACGGITFPRYIMYLYNAILRFLLFQRLTSPLMAPIFANGDSFYVVQVVPHRHFHGFVTHSYFSANEPRRSADVNLSDNKLFIQFPYELLNSFSHSSHWNASVSMATSSAVFNYS